MTAREAEQAGGVAPEIVAAVRIIDAYGAARGDGEGVQNAATLLLETIRAKDAEIARLRADNAALLEVAQLWMKSKKEYGDGNAPGHAHSVPKHWDVDGSPCDWCHTEWPRLKAIVLSDHPGTVLLEEMAKDKEAIRDLGAFIWDWGVSWLGDWHTTLCHGRREATGNQQCLKECERDRSVLRRVGRLP